MPQESKTTKISAEARELADRMWSYADLGRADFLKHASGFVQRALDARPQSEAQWRDISTAPRDGSDFLLYSEGYGVKIAHYELADCEFYSGEDYIPTPSETAKWMPLLEPPNQSPHLPAYNINDLAEKPHISEGVNQEIRPPSIATPESRDFTIPCQIRVLATFDKGVKVSTVQGAIDRLRAASAEQEKTIARLRSEIALISAECELMAYTSAGDPRQHNDMIWHAATAEKLKKILADTAQKGDGK